ncbi:hypothetical protein [Streptosporangium sandarakinum]
MAPDIQKTPDEPNSEIRALLEALREATSRESAGNAAWSISERICYAGVEVAPSAAPAVEYCWELAGDPGFPWRHYAIQLITCVASACGVTGRSSADLSGEPAPGSAEGFAEEAVLSRIAVASGLLDDPDKEIRGSCIELMGHAHPDPSRVISEFTHALHRETDPVLQADLAEAITNASMRTTGGSRWGAAGSPAADLLLHDNPAVRWRVARILLWARAGEDDSSLQKIADSAYQEVAAQHLFRDEFA